MWTRKTDSDRFMGTSEAKSLRLSPVFALITVLAAAALVLLAAAFLYSLPLRFSIIPDAEKADLGAEMLIAEEMPFLSDIRYMGYSSADEESAIPVHMRWYEARLPGYLSLGSNAFALTLARFDNDSGRLAQLHVFIGTPDAIEKAVLRYDASFQKDE